MKLNPIFIYFMTSGLLVSNFAFCQDLKDINPSLYNTNALYASAGIGGVYLAGSITYERILGQYPNKFISATFAKVGFGGYVDWGDGGKVIYAQFGVMTGHKNSHFELSAGPNFLGLNDFSVPPIAGGMGYRFQQPGKSFLFRTGLAYPEALYVGLGFSF